MRTPMPAHRADSPTRHRVVRTPPRPVALLGLALTALVFLPGCLSLRWGGLGEGRLESAEFPVDLEPDLPVRVYEPIDESSADIFLTDLTNDEIIAALADPAAGTTGTIIYAHMFVRPRPGRTPIDTTAISVTVRYILLARGSVGVYDGGGFLLPTGKPGREYFAGRIPDADLRLAATTPGFVDRIGRGELSLRFRARRDPETVDLIRRLADRAFRRAEPVPTTTDEAP